jgi:DNA-directed RNA polymerase subunit RPC12/RpoP
MSIEFICEHCGGTLRVEDYLAGQTIECQHCRRPVAIPQEGVTAIIHFRCLACGEKFRVPHTLSGSRTKCPECGAVLEVPATGSEAPAPPEDAPAPPVADDTFDEPAPTVTAHRIARHSRKGRRSAPGTQLDAAEPGDVLYVPSQQKMGVGMIILFVGIAALAVIALLVLLKKTDAPERMPSLDAEVKFDPIRDVLIITNTMAEPWEGVVLTVRTRHGGEYTYNLERLAPREPLTLSCSRFTDDNGQALDNVKNPGDVLIIMARYGGRTHRREAVMPTAPPPTPKGAP